MTRPWTALGALALAPAALAQVDPACRDLPRPDDYDEQSQQDFLANHVALATTYSPLHAPVPHESGRGAVGVDLAVIPPLSCRRRYVLDWSKTEETNRLPVLPRPRVSFAFPAIGPVIPYASFAYVPPVTVAATRSVLLSGEVGAGLRLGPEDRVQIGLRFHATSTKVVADIATAFNRFDPPVDDLYLASTFGMDLSAGYALGAVTPYLALGVLDASTFFYIGDDGVVTNNLHPYAGLAGSLGVDGLVGERFRFGAELYGAPGGYSRPDPSAVDLKPASRYGHLYTARLRLAFEL